MSATILGHDRAVEQFLSAWGTRRLHHAWLLAGPRGVGKASFTEEALVENIRAFADAVMKAKPSGAKGTFLKKVAVDSTMGPGVKIEPANLVGGAG